MEADLIEDGGEAVIANPRQISEDFWDKLSQLQGSASLKYVDPQIVAINQRSCAWWVPAGERVLRFRTNDRAINALDNGGFPQPPLLMIARNNTLRVFALPENARPTLETPLLFTPYYNVDGRTGAVCIGSGVRPDGSKPEEHARWTDEFFRSYFTHNSMKAAWTPQFTHAELWLAAKEAGVFKAEWLLPAKVTLRAVMK